jgi:outer membrane protein assembly factor BamB
VEPLTADDPVRVGGYRLEARLGSGGMGQVFLGSSPDGRAVAVKVVHGSLAADQAFRVRFRREVAAAQAVSGAYTASVVAAGPDDDPPWMATEFVEGPSLWDAVTTTGPLPAPSVWRLAAGLVEALRAVHSCGLVHRDLKPQNVLLAEDGPRLIDFGVCQALGDSAVTATGLIVGTPPYMSPEQAKGKRAEASSDVFSLGCVLAFAATGTPPYGNGQPAAVLYRIVHAAPALGDLDGEMHDMIAACLAKPPADRPGLSALARDISAGAYHADQHAAGPAAAPPVPSWPAEVASLIRDRRRPLDGQDEAAEADQPAAPNTVTGVGRPGPAALGQRRAAAVRPAVADQPPAPAAQPPAAASQGPAGAERQPAAAYWSAAAEQSRASAAGRDSVAADWDALIGPPPAAAGTPDAAAPAAPARHGPRLTRRRVLLGLSGAAAVGLGVLVREELSRPTVIHPASAGPKGTTTPGPSPQRRAKTPRLPGSTLWKSSAGGGVLLGPAVTSGVACVVASQFVLCGLDSSDGATLWRKTIPRGSITWSLAAADGTFYIVGNNGVLYALHAVNGRTLWQARGMFGGPSLQDGVIYIASAVTAGSAPLNALRADTGRRIWSTSAINGGAVYATAAGDFVYVTGYFGSLSALRTSDGTEIWNTSPGGGTQSDPVAAGGVVYVTGQNNSLYALRGTDGATLWHTSDIGQMQTPAASASTVFVVDSQGDLAALNAQSGARLWSTGLGGGVAQGPAAAGGVVYMAGIDENLYAVRASSGTLIWKTPISGGAVAAPVAAGDAVYVAAAGNKLYAVQA